MRSLARAVCATLLIAALPAPRAEAQFPAFAQTQTYSAIGYSVDTTRGWSFTVTAPLTVTELGFWDSTPPDGLTAAHPIGIWRDDGTLLTSATVPAGTGAPLEGTFRWVATTPVVIEPDNTYVIGAYWSGVGSDTTLRAGENVIFDARVTPGEGRAVNTVGLTYPAQAFNLELSVNFKATPAPEVAVLPGPGVVGLALLLLAVLVGRMVAPGGSGWKRSAT